ncbi:TPA: transcription termination/antitermination NusG family protein [Salmonella enterica]
MYEWYVLYCNNQDVERITRRVEGLDVEVFCPRYIKVTPRKDCRAVRQEEKVLFPNYLFLCFDVNVTHTSTITSIPGAHGFVSFGSTPCRFAFLGTVRRRVNGRHDPRYWRMGIQQRG